MIIDILIDDVNNRLVIAASYDDDDCMNDNYLIDQYLIRSFVHSLLFYHSFISSPFLTLGFVSLAALLCVVFYLAVFVPLTSKRPVVDLATHAPRAVPAGAIAGVATFIL